MNALLLVGQGIGNMVMASPLIAALDAMGYRVTIHARPDWLAAARDLFDGLPEVDEVTDRLAADEFDVVCHTVWRREPVGGREIFPDELDLRTTHEAAVNMSAVARLGYRWEEEAVSYRLSAVSGKRKEGAVSGQLSAFSRRKRERPTTSTSSSTSTRKIRGEGPYLKPAAWSLKPHDYVVFAPGCKEDAFWARKKWTGWGELAGMIDAPVKVLHSQAIGSPWVSACDDLSGQTTLREAIDIIAAAGAFVGIDNGLAHVAAAVGTPAVVLFGATSEIKNRPLGRGVCVVARHELGCRPCQMTERWEECTRWRCMQIEPSEVARRLTAFCGPPSSPAATHAATAPIATHPCTSSPDS